MRLQLFKTRAKLRREASNWLARLKAGDGDISREAFWRWHNSHPANAEAFARVSRTYEEAGLLRNSPVARERSLEAHATHSASHRNFAFAAMLAGLLLVPVTATALYQSGLPPFELRETFLLSTGVGEIRRVTLDDGTDLTLDTQSRARLVIHGSKRQVVLEQGRARFGVANGRRPFEIIAGGRRIESTGGLFDVDLTSTRFFHLLSGNAEGGPARIAVRPAVDKKGFRTARAQPVADWTRGVLQFDATPLADAAVAANRYSRNRIVLSDPSLGSVTVTGAFRAGDNARLARALGETLDLDSTRTADGNFLLTERRSKKKVG